MSDRHFPEERAPGERPTISNSIGVRSLILLAAAILVLGFWYLSTMQVCLPLDKGQWGTFDEAVRGSRCFGYRSSVFWSAMSLKATYYLGGYIVLVGLAAVVGWLTYDFKVFLKMAAGLILAAVLLQLFVHFVVH